MVQCWNWYTGRSQKPMGETPCGFESHLDYKK